MFEYIGGKDGHGPDVLRAWGHVFKRGKPVKIETVIVNGNKITEAHITGKLRGNSHFHEMDGRTVVKSEKKKRKPKKAKDPTSIAPVAPSPAELPEPPGD